MIIHYKKKNSERERFLDMMAEEKKYDRNF